MRGAVALLLSLFFALMAGVMCVPGALSNTSNGAHAIIPTILTPSPQIVVHKQHAISNVSNVPGENRSVSAVWHNISIEGDPDYEVIAIVDPLDCIDKINNSKSDNEMRREIKMNYPDLTVTEFISPSREDRRASVVIANTGIKNASNVTVRFEVSEYQEIEIMGSKTASHAS